MRRQRERPRNRGGRQPKHPPKPRLLVDWNISSTASVLKSEFHLSVTVANPTDSDEINIERARAGGLILVTTDGGDPKRLRLAKSPGIVLISGRLQHDTASAASLI